MSRVSLDRCRGVTEAGGRVQAGVSGLCRASAAGLLVLLAGCAQEKMSPVEWWHSLEGGRIAEDRPPPPLVEAPYPNLSTVPDKPPSPDNGARAKLDTGLVADRSNAQYAASLAPLPAVPAAPARPTKPPPLPTGEDSMGATLPAASAPPPPPQRADGPMTPLRRVPTQPVQAAPLAPPPGAAVAEAEPATPSVPDPPDGPPPPAKVSTAASDQPRPSGADLVSQPVKPGTPAAPLASLPPVPAAPPAPAVLPGLPAGTLPTPPPVQPPAPPPPPPPKPTNAPVLVPFAPGSSILPVESLASLKLLSRERGANLVNVTGYGDAPGVDAVTQANAVPLALARARAIAQQLLASGVPSSAIRISAQAEGKGGAASLTN